MTKLSFTRAQSPESLFQALSMFQDELQRRISFGKSSIQWSIVGGTRSSNATIVHELPTTPAAVLAMVVASGSEPAIAATVVSVTATDFQVYGEYVTGAGAGGTQSRELYWLAIV